MIIAPLSVPITKKKKFLINLNIYRNAHYMTLNKAKVLYKEHMKEQIIKLPTYNYIQADYTLFPRTKHKQDISNILSIHDKFFMDALVDFNKLIDDNYLHLPRVTYSFGEVDKSNPRVEIKLTELRK